MSEERTPPWDLASWLRSRAEPGDDIDTPLFLEAAEQLDALSRIHAELDGREWSSDTTAYIAEDLGTIGLAVRDLSTCDCDSRSWNGEEHDTLCPLAGLTRN